MYALGMLLAFLTLIAGMVGYLVTGNIVMLVLVGVGIVGVSVTFVVSRGAPRRR